MTVDWIRAGLKHTGKTRSGLAKALGRSPSAEISKLAASESIVVTGTVPDVRPYLAHANAAIAPLRIARGIQNKVLEAMAMARAVFVSTAGLEGIDAEPGREV